MITLSLVTCVGHELVTVRSHNLQDTKLVRSKPKICFLKKKLSLKCQNNDLVADSPIKIDRLTQDIEDLK